MISIAGPSVVRRTTLFLVGLAVLAAVTGIGHFLLLSTIATPGLSLWTAVESYVSFYLIVFVGSAFVSRVVSGTWRMKALDRLLFALLVANVFMTYLLPRDAWTLSGTLLAATGLAFPFCFALERAILDAPKRDLSIAFAVALGIGGSLIATGEATKAERERVEEIQRTQAVADLCAELGSLSPKARAACARIQIR